MGYKKKTDKTLFAMSKKNLIHVYLKLENGIEPKFETNFSIIYDYPLSTEQDYKNLENKIKTIGWRKYKALYECVNEKYLCEEDFFIACKIVSLTPLN